MRHIKKTILGSLKIFQLLARFTLLLIILISTSAYAQEPILDTNINVYDNKKEGNIEAGTLNTAKTPIKRTFTAQVYESQYLPPAFYGTWQVSQFLITSNALNRFKKTTYDIWILNQVGDTIHLTNPDSGGKSKITVNEVKNNTATFTCELKEGRAILKEQPTITVEGDTFHGQNIFQIQYYKKKKLMYTQEAILRISGRKISGPTLELFKR